MGRIFLIGFIAALLGGCQSLPSQPSFSSYLVLPRTTTADGKSVYTLPQFASPVAQGEPDSCNGLAVAPSKLARNACILDLMTDIDAAYYNYEIAVNNAISRTNAALTIAQNAFSLSGTAAGGTASTVLNSLATFSGDLKTTLSDELLYKTTLQILLSTMQADRSKQAAQIHLSMQSEVDIYSMNQARNDLLAYFYAGTAAHALTEANNNAAADAKKCQAADATVKAAVAQGAVPKAAGGAAGAGAMAAATSNAGGTTSDQCNKIADSMTFKFDTGATTADLLAFLAPSGIYSKDAAAALTSCIKSTTTPSGFHVTDYTLSDKSYDLGSLVSDASVDSKYKSQLLTCGKLAMAKAQSAPPAGGAKPPAGGAQQKPPAAAAAPTK